jgi:uncharacterized protein (DUF952 family)
MPLIYKILSADLWREAEGKGRLEGAGIDRRDGYIHFSTAGQAEETAARHFAGVHNLLLVACRAEDLGDGLKWEPSRGGALFPHLYGTLAVAHAVLVKPLPWNGTAHDFPEGWQS